MRIVFFWRSGGGYRERNEIYRAWEKKENSMCPSEGQLWFDQWAKSVNIWCPSKNGVASVYFCAALGVDDSFFFSASEDSQDSAVYYSFNCFKSHQGMWLWNSHV